MKRLSLLFASSVLLCSASSAMAVSGAYIGIKGGYNSSAFPNDKTTISTMTYTTPGGITDSFDNYNTSNTKSSNYFANIHAGYLFPIKDNIQIGPQVGYSYYGENKISNLANQQALANEFENQKGSAKINLSSINFYVVGEYDFSNYFIQLRGGIAYIMNSTSSDYQVFDDTVDATYRKNIKSDGGFFPIAGISLGGYISQHISASISYDHIFAANSYNFDSIGNYNETSYIKVPSMDLIGAQISYHF